MSLRAPLLLLALLAVSAVAQDQSPSWILPLAPAGYGGPGVINPYSNVNPLNPMAAQMEAQATGQTTTSTPQSQLGAAGNSATAPHAFIEVGASHIREETPVPPTPFNHEFGDAFIHPHVMTASPPAHIADVHAYLQKATERTAVDEAMLTAFPEIDGNCVECVVPHVEGQCVCHPARLNCPCEKKEFTAPEMWEDATFRPAEVVEEKPRERGVKVNFVDKLPAAGSLQPTNDVVSSTVLHPNLIELEAPCGCPITSDACVCRKEKPNYVHPEIVEPCENDCEKKSSDNDKHYFFVKPDHPCGCDTCPCPPPPVQYVAAEVVEKKKKLVCACILQPVCPCAGKF